VTTRSPYATCWTTPARRSPSSPGDLGPISPKTRSCSSLRQVIQIIGEAANRVSKEGQTRYPDIPWREAIAARNRIVHGYDSVDYDIIWRILTEEFPVLITALERALPEHTG
jgi:uncharacterized protein with HEPN domain